MGLIDRKASNAEKAMGEQLADRVERGPIWKAYFFLSLTGGIITLAGFLLGFVPKLPTAIWKDLTIAGVGVFMVANAFSLVLGIRYQNPRWSYSSTVGFALFALFAGTLLPVHTSTEWVMSWRPVVCFGGWMALTATSFFVRRLPVGQGEGAETFTDVPPFVKKVLLHSEGGSSVEAALDAARAPKDAVGRTEAILHLMEYCVAVPGNKAVVTYLMNLAADVGEDLRRSAIFALVEGGSGPGFGLALERARSDPDPWVRESTLEVLKLTARTMRDRIRGSYEETKEWNRRQRALQNLAGELTTSDPQPEVRKEAASLLKAVKGF